jgi:glutamyl/glutaminyl-tRNA synthetase
MNKNPNWGGSRIGAGRPKEENTKKSVIVRVAEELLPVIKTLKEQLRAGQTVESLLNVTDNQDVDLQSEIQVLNDLVKFQNNKIYELNKQPLAEKNNELIIRNNDFIVKYNEEHARAESLKGELEQFKKTNLELMLQKDAEHSKAIKLQTKVRSLHSSNEELKSQLEELAHKEHD